MRASRLVELLVRLQLQGGASAAELAETFEVSVRTIYRDVEALSIAGVPVYTEVGRNGGIRIDPSYRIAGLPRLEPGEARSLLFAIVPAIADQLGFDSAAADRTLLPSMETSTEAAARVVRDRLLVEPTRWFVAPDETPALDDVARAVWESRQVRLTYRGNEVAVQPLGLIMKGDAWYLLAGGRGSAVRSFRLFRLSRVDAVELLDQRFERPPDFDLGAAWAERRQAFIDRVAPDYVATVRVAPEAEFRLAMLDEAAVELPLSDRIERDEHGWARMELAFETPERAAWHLMRFGVDAEVLGPPELRDRIGALAGSIAAVYSAT